MRIGFALDMGLVSVDVDGHETFGLGAVFLSELTRLAFQLLL